MTQPLALVFYERLLPGSQLVNRLQDLNYRVQAVANTAALLECAEQTKPMLVLADLESTHENICAAITRLKKNDSTKHLPIIAFGGETTPGLRQAAQAAGATLIVADSAILDQLPQCLEQALRVD